MSETGKPAGATTIDAGRLGSFGERAALLRGSGAP